jgi:RimJ/RimL family protein N-acetyltransferase
MVPPKSLHIETKRLLLRPTRVGDSMRAFEIQNNWNVTRNLRLAAFPPASVDMANWFAQHEVEWLEGTAFRFATLWREVMIGMVDLDQISGGEGDIGYWLDEAYWGQGIASEAASAVVLFAFKQGGLQSLRSGHAVDNPASGRVLLKLGFEPYEEVAVTSRARGTSIVQRRYRLKNQ